MELLQIIIRTLFFYFFICLMYRIMGKREIGQLGIIDLIVSILVAELVAISIEQLDRSIFYTIIPLIILVILELILARLSLKNKTFRTYFNGKPTVIILNGKINFKEMVRQRYSLDDLLLSIRQKGIANIKDVEYAILETNGKLSIFKYNLLHTSSSYPFPLIIDRVVDLNTLKRINKNETWLNNELHKKRLSLNDIFYAFYQNNKIYIIKYKDID